MIWNERTIGKALQHQVFNRAVCIVDNCLWTGFEADLLIIEPKLRLIDVEIKVSRADLKADFHKDKWLDFGPPMTFNVPREMRPRKLWPRDVWKHYVAVPREIWNDDLLPHLGSPKSGVLILWDREGSASIRCVKRATPNKNAKQLTSVQVLDVARLASLRLWNSYDALSRAHADNLRIHAMHEAKEPA